MAKMYEPEMYTPYNLASGKSFTPSEMRKEYSRLAAIVKKRSARLIEAGFEGRAYDVKNLGDISPEKLPEALSSLARYVESPVNTVRGARQQRERTIETFRDKYGISGLSVENYDRFIEEMKRVHARRSGRFIYRRIRGLRAVQTAAKKAGINYTP